MRLLLAVIAVLAAFFFSTGWAEVNPVAPQASSVKGEVLEVMDVDAFTYLRLKTKDGETWAAVGKSPVKKGTEDWVVTDAQREEILAKMAAYRKSQPGVYIGFPGDEKKFGGCLSSGRGFLHVSASGDVEACPFAPFSDSSLRDVPLREALNSRLFRKLREHHDQLIESNGGCALWKRPEWVKSLME